MEYGLRTHNYCAFYVAEPFNPCALGAFATHDFCHYQMLKAWKGKDTTFPFSDAHAATYSVRDSSDWESTLKPRLRNRLRLSKNIILFLSDFTGNSRALREEIDYGINTLGLPVIIIYPEFDNIDKIVDKNNTFRLAVKNLWAKLPILRDSMHKVPTLHLPMKKETIKDGLSNRMFMINSKGSPAKYI
ncbi:TIR domain-containing protein [Alkanindiges illinoisensis]|uniref:TIR domain-containing protein n=1 Tax=Alkanindiges illinoisensis TaxID=197183 RepID=UPI00047ADD91|nr:hypothetical protein [Alkanindiges illinoisensis]